MLPFALAATLATVSAAPLRLSTADDDWDAPAYGDEHDREAHIRIIGWGGTALGDVGSGRSSSFVGGEAGWAFDHIDLSLAGSGYRNLADATRTWTPVLLTRLTQRFRVGQGVEAAFGFGLGAGRPRGWRAWYQVALGIRVPIAPLFLAGELAFETEDLLRLGAGLGIAF